MIANNPMGFSSNQKIFGTTLHGKRGLRKENAKRIIRIVIEQDRESGFQNEAGDTDRAVPSITARSAALQNENSNSGHSGGNIDSIREIDLAKEIESYEADLIRSALMQTCGRQRQAARLLNVKTSTLNSKIKRYGLLESTPLILQTRA